ncbi:nitroreductase [Aeromicrobium sp. S22]|uniref:nitroreductase n=1 Tax=Aeromicrobium sp. S22 TaxID=2662029 RepID=UPI0013C16727|nr:nitroreductase [Aeromicrobium sp. S22]MRK01689.1 nitroreductase [Aeromicrobium sp. S22]
MNVTEAMVSRRSVRGFLDTPLDRAVIEEVLEIASRAPSGGNLQPWRIVALTGAPLRHLTKRMSERLETGGEPDESLFPIYPAQVSSPYRDYRFRNAEQLYGAVGIPRQDKAARRAWFARNYQFFGAPVGLFCYVDQQMGSAQWSDLGMYLQSVMLLLQERGLGSCAQEAWSAYHRTVAEIVDPPPEWMLFCGLAVGYEDRDEPANNYRTERAPLGDFASFLGWDEN